METTRSTPALVRSIGTREDVRPGRTVTTAVIALRRPRPVRPADRQGYRPSRHAATAGPP